MHNDYSDNSEGNISNTEVSGSFLVNGLVDISATVKYGTSKLKLKRNTTYLLKTGENCYIILRVLEDKSVRYVIHDNDRILKGEI